MPLIGSLAAGADHVLDYRAADLADQILAIAPNGVDRAVEVEFGLNADLLHQVVRANGTIAAYGSGKEMAPTFPFGPYLFKATNRHRVDLYPAQGRADAAIDALHRAHAAGAFKPAVHHILPLEDSAAAHDATMTPGRGCSIDKDALISDSMSFPAQTLRVSVKKLRAFPFPPARNHGFLVKRSGEIYANQSMRI